MRFLFTSLFSNDLGLLTSSLPIATALQDRGHVVAACNPLRAPGALIAEAGLKNLPIRQVRPKVYAPSTPEVWNIDHFAALTGMLDERFVQKVCQLFLNTIDLYRPDVVVDSWNPCACIAARVRNVPVVTLIHSYVHPLSQGFIWWRPSPPNIPTPLEVVNRVLTEYALKPVQRVADLYVGDLTLVHGTAATDPLPPEAQITYTGAILWQKNSARLPLEVERFSARRPVIWVYTGNPQYGPIPSWADSAVVLRTCIAALANTPVRVVVTTGFHSLPQSVGQLPDNFMYIPYVAGLEMAKHSALLIHHGGYNSCQLGLLTGTPSLVLPTFSEREGNARRVARLGAGEFLIPTIDERGQKHVPIEQFSQAVWNILDQEMYVERARASGELLCAGRGPQQTADLLEQFIMTG
jgi:UDP:flavonoid glycosyltransferase YjiC (YdhE family)